MNSEPEKTYTALIVEDDESIAEAIVFNLEKEGFHCLSARDGLEGLRLLRRQKPGILILDLMLPKMDGWQLCKQIREEGYDLPIIVCSARTSDFDKVEMLEMGADDYLVKPFSMAELVARVKANLRRPGLRTQTNMDVIKTGPLVIDPQQREVYVEGKPIGFTPKELAIVHLLARSAPNPISREDIYQTVWGYEMLHGDRSVDVFVRRARKKLAGAVPGQTFIQTQYGYGYKFQVGEAEPEAQPGQEQGAKPEA